MFDSIQQPILDDLRRYSEMFGRVMHSDNALLAAALAHIAQRPGKLMRPILILLSARMGGCVNQEVLHAAVALELLHTSSLVHDDVVDESARRRGVPSVNALWDNKAAVLVGDYLAAAVLDEASLTGRMDVVERIGWLAKTLADGELLQLSATSLDTFDEADYFRVIERKTASLFSTCCWVGATLSGAPSQTVQALETFGHRIGLCFQLRDDIFDFDDTLDVGKPKGNDMQEGKLTLPVLYALQTAGDDRYRSLALKVRRGEADPDEMRRLAAFVVSHGGVAYAQQRMQQFAAEAHTLVDTLATGTANAIATALKDYMDYVIRRQR